MSEVSDACQIILVTGKGAYYLGKITSFAAGRILKVMETVYLSKWEGMTSLNRFRAIKGDEFCFVNIQTEDRAALSGIFKEMEAHGILLARLPDLCGGDGRTQIVIAPSDAAKFQAFLLDHGAGKYQDIKVGRISAEDYAKTGYDGEGRETKEFASLTDSARESVREERQIKDRPPAGLLSRLRRSPGREQEEKEFFNNKEETLFFPGRSPAVLYALRRHDEAAGERSGIWIFDPPLKEHEKWGMYQLPDGVHAVVIPNRDRYEFFSETGEKLYRAALIEQESYNLINLSTGEMKLVSGKEIAGELLRTDPVKENEELKNLGKNLGIAEGLLAEPAFKEETKGESPVPVFTLSVSDALNSGTAALPLEYRVADETAPGGYRSILFSAADAKSIPGTDFIRIPLTDPDGTKEVLTVNAKISEKEGLLCFADPAGRGVALTLTGEEEEPDLLVHFNRSGTPEFTVDQNGQRARLSIYPKREYEVSLIKDGREDEKAVLSGEQILTRTGRETDRQRKPEAVPSFKEEGQPVRDIFEKTARMPSGR